MRMTTLMEEVMKDDTLAVQICTPVIGSRDNVNLKSIFELIEKETKNDKNHKEVADQIALHHTNDRIIEFPNNPNLETSFSTNVTPDNFSGRKRKPPDRLTY